MSNANFREFRSQALSDYLYLAGETLADDGILFCQCLGGEIFTKNDTLKEKLFGAGFAPLLYLPDSGNIEVELPQSNLAFEKKFVVSAGVFIKSTHPAFETYHKVENYSQKFVAGEIEILHMLLGQPGERKVYERNDIFKLVEEKLAEKQRKHSTI
jgi:hypothetical protein